MSAGKSGPLDCARRLLQAFEGCIAQLVPVAHGPGCRGKAAPCPRHAGDDRPNIGKLPAGNAAKHGGAGQNRLFGFRGENWDARGLGKDLARRIMAARAAADQNPLGRRGGGSG